LDSTLVPKVLNGSKVLISQFFKVRHEKLGSRGEKWRDRGLVKDDFTLDWAKGVYEVIWGTDGEQVDKITHISGQTADVSDFLIKPDNNFGGNHSDMFCFFRKGRQDLNLHQFFAAKDVEMLFTKECFTEDAERALDLCKMTESVKESLTGASTNEVFSMAKAHADQKRKEAMQAKPRIPRKGLTAPLSAISPAKP
jgi:hypothetical protein